MGNHVLVGRLEFGVSGAPDFLRDADGRILAYPCEANMLGWATGHGYKELTSAQIAESTSGLARGEDSAEPAAHPAGELEPEAPVAPEPVDVEGVTPADDAEGVQVAANTGARRGRPRKAPAV